MKKQAATSPETGKRHDFYLLEASGWVNIIPVTPDGKIVLVRQYRHGSEEITLEIPGGMIEAGQTPLEAAERELAEETGYTTDSMHYLGKVRPNPAIFNNFCYTYLAWNAAQTLSAEPDETEEIEVITVGIDEIPEIISRGIIDHALVLAAFQHFYLNIGLFTQLKLENDYRENIVKRFENETR